MVTHQELLELSLHLQEDTRTPVAVSVLKALGTFERPSQVSSLLQEGRRQLAQLAETLFPNDADKNLVPVRVHGDGNCLFSISFSTALR